ncbi:MAG: tetratricopeptide repeat protein [Cyanobacteria bacterium P01_G01_bin.67]
MSLKTKTKILLTLLSVEIITLYIALTPVAKAQKVFSATPVSQDSIAEAKHLSELGKIKAEYQNYRGAIADFSRAILLNPNEADFYYQRGLILRELSDLQAAIQDFDDAILRNPNHAWAYLQRAGVFFNFQSNQGLTSFRDRDFKYRQTAFNRGDARGILDLRVARDLFAQQGDQEGFKTADRLIKHFAGNLESQGETNF